MKKIASLVMALAFFGAAFAQSDIRLAVLEPEGKGIAESDRWVLSLVQGSIIGDFNKYSGMTVIDRQNLEKVFDEWEESESGKYSDENRVKIGNLTNASHILRGIVTKTSSAFMLEFSVTDIESGERKASYSPKPVSLLALEDLSAVKEATADLLKQLGVELTSEALAELKHTENTVKIQAETALARGIAAKRQGTEVAALSYFYQAAALDPSLLEATNRSSVMAANISSGNIGADTRNDILWRRDWVNRLTEAEKFFDGLFKSNPLPYVLFYSTEIIPGDINYQAETQTLSINTNLRATGEVHTWLASVEKSLQAVYDGLNATNKKRDWGLQDWPWRGVTDLRPFESKSRNFSISAELLGSNGATIGSASFQSRGEWRFNGYGRPQITISGDDMKQVSFKSVKADDISDRITIRIASVNGAEANAAARTGVLQIKAITGEEWDSYVQFRMRGSEVIGYNGKGGNLIIPDSIWKEPVASIGANAFSHKQLTEATIPNGIKSIGERAFANNSIERVTIGAKVYVAQNSFDGDFAYKYNQVDSESLLANRAGTYIYSKTEDWKPFHLSELTESEKEEKRKFQNAYEEKKRKAEEEEAERKRKAEEFGKILDKELGSYEDRQKEAKKANLASWYSRPVFGLGILMNINSIDDIYAWPGFLVSLGAELFNAGRFDFFKLGANLNFGAGGFDENTVKEINKIDKLDNSAMMFFKLGVSAKLYPTSFLYLSGGSSYGWYGGYEGKSASGNKVSGGGASALEFPVGGGLTLYKDMDSVISLEGLYNIGTGTISIIIYL